MLNESNDRAKASPQLESIDDLYQPLTWLLRFWHRHPMRGNDVHVSEVLYPKIRSLDFRDLVCLLGRVQPNDVEHAISEVLD